MIIGISGKIGSGKDTVAQVIQFLTLPPHEMADWTTFLLEYDNDKWDTPWEVKKFADKLKDIVCMLIGCTRVQLENRDFKEGALGEEWRIWYLTSYKFATTENPNGRVSGIYSSEEEAKAAYELNKENFSALDIESEVLTPRKMLQLIGTEGGRNLIHPNVWVNSLIADYESVATTSPYDYFDTYQEWPNWLVTDTRFTNEAEAVLKKRGILIRVNRGDGNTGEHPSETALDNYDKFTYVIDNNGTFEDLIGNVKKILTKENLL